VISRKRETGFICLKFAGNYFTVNWRLWWRCGIFVGPRVHGGIAKIFIW
jgi:hypothetical protein